MSHGGDLVTWVNWTDREGNQQVVSSWKCWPIAACAFSQDLSEGAGRNCRFGQTHFLFTPTYDFNTFKPHPNIPTNLWFQRVGVVEQQFHCLGFRFFQAIVRIQNKDKTARWFAS